MKKINFENHRVNKARPSEYISVITSDGKIESGWTNGRTLQQIGNDFGTFKKDWFYFRHEAEAYVVKNKKDFE